MALYAVVDENNTISNICEWDGESQWQPPAGSRAVLLPPDGNIGDTVNKANVLIKAPPTPSIPPKSLTVEEKLARIGLTIAELKTALQP